MLFSKKFVAAGLEYADCDREVAAPYMRKSFTLDRIPRKIEITVTGLGFYKMYVNGRDVTATHLAPYVSNPDRFIVYDTYDIKDHVRVGKNTIAFLLGNGIQNNYGGFIWSFEEASFRSSPRLAFAIEIESGDTKTVIEADSTVLTHASPLVANDFRIGVRYDARLEIEGWSCPELDDTDWSPAIPVATYEGTAVCSDIKPIKVTATREPIAIFREGDAFIYDFGINDTGLTRLRICGERGRKITVLHGEYLRDGIFDQKNILFLHNPLSNGKPAYTQQTEYILKGEGIEEYIPDFTYYGFRYARVEGICEAEATPELLTCLVMHTDLEEIGGFACSDEVLNTLEQMSHRSTLSNFLHHPLDCPHREKNGWTGDAALSAEQTMLRFDPDKNYATWLHALICDQTENGAIPCINPTAGWGYGWGSGPAWDRVIVELPYQEYVLRGNLDLARIAAAAMLKYFGFLRAHVTEWGLIAFGLGDWLAPDKAFRPSLGFTDTLVSSDMLKKAALLFKAMGDTGEAERLLAFSDELREAIRERLLDTRTMTFDNGGEAAQALAIYHGLCNSAEERQAAIKVLLREIEAQDGHMTIGILGQKGLFRVLCEAGYADLALRMMTRPDAPSYGTMIRNGYTTIAESITDEVMSLNHHCWCDFSAFLITHIAGLRLNPSLQDVGELLVAPSFPVSLSFAKAYHKAPAGRIEVHWERTGNGRIRLSLTVPPRMTAQIKLPRGYVFEDGRTERVGTAGIFTVIEK